MGNGEKFSLWDGKIVVSSYIFNEFGGKFKENYWKLGQIGQHTSKLVKVGHFGISPKLVNSVKWGRLGALLFPGIQA